MQKPNTLSTTPHHATRRPQNGRTLLSRIAALALLALFLTTAAPLTWAEDAAPAANAKPAAKVVNINTADAAQLALLPRVGPAVAQRILEYREANGKFKETGDLVLVQGIGEKTLALLEPYVAVSGETTLTEKVRSARTSSGDE